MSVDSFDLPTFHLLFKRVDFKTKPNTANFTGYKHSSVALKQDGGINIVDKQDRDIKSDSVVNENAL